jgi:DNA polymerase-1
MRSIIDGNSLLFRAYYGVRQRLTRPDGIPVNAVFGFCSMVLPLLSEAKPDDEIICVFDAHRRNWRNDIYPEYKANRDATPPDLVAQIEIARAAVRAMGMPCLVLPNVEADDVIATLACGNSSISKKDGMTRIISSDKDLMQLVSPHCFVFDTMKGEELHERDVARKFGVRPNQMIDYQSLVGDSSDNVPGVHGIGPKKAAELLNQFETLENIYGNLDKIKNERARQLLTDGRDSAFMSKKLVALKTDVDIPDFPKYNFDPETARSFFLNEISSPFLAEKMRKLFNLPITPTDTSNGIFFFSMPEDGGLPAPDIMDKLLDSKIKKVAWDWKTIFHKLDSSGIDVSQIRPIDDVMLMNYAANRKDRGDLAEDYGAFTRAPAKIYETDLPILRPLFRMEKKGVLVDVAKLGEISEKLHEQANELQAKIWDLAGEEFNIASPKQLAEILFDKLRLPTDRSRGTDADKLSELAAENIIAQLVLDWRTLTKLTGTYTDVLPKSIGTDGRIHTTYLQTSTNTGRLSSQNPNLQNIPVKSEMGEEIRKCFISAPGNVLISVDYSQIQLRLLAHLADVRALKDAFSKNKDIHAETAAKIFGIVSPQNRYIAKTINFSIIYGVSPFGLAAQLGITQREAAAIISDYMAGFPEVKKYIEDTKKFALANGYVETPLGRRIMFPDINNPRLRNYSLRAAVNAPIQGFEADIMRLAMAKLDVLPVDMIMQVHDEFVFECPKDSAENHAKQIKEIMESIVSISVPLVADYKISEQWKK